ncbi:MAG: tRNA lysidine(34) synthetase TilS [Epsilonproteobacteria bacterium]|nr:tRNA lysidine(34) synthetase TilS [Campylobacterota bacterium]
MNLSLNREALDTLRGGKSLLAFSGGVDSSALLFLLRDKGIEFDIALVNYQTRLESRQEEEYAISLAKRFSIKAHTVKAPKFHNNFEKRARDFRYGFFKSLIGRYGYDNLITAHQLNDQLEWLLMRLVKGAGLVELLGLAPVVERDGYRVVRPLLNISKGELLSYLDREGHRYFIDESNSDVRYERNYFRREFSDRLIGEYREGIIRSFEYLNRDRDIVLSGYRELYSHREFHIIKIGGLHHKVRVVDIYLKRLGYLLSSAQRREVERGDSIVIGGVWAIEHIDNLLYIAPYIRESMPKQFKERCRLLRIPPKVRGYIYSIGLYESLDLISKAISYCDSNPK